MRFFSDSGEPSAQNSPHSLRIGIFLETFSPELVDHQVCAASSHEVLVASGIVGVCTFQVPEDSLLADHVLPALSTALASQLDC